MWDNEEWAKNHIQKKRKVTPLEAWEAVFEANIPPIPMRSPDQLNYPPFIRYWVIGKTIKGRLLFVAWEKHRETLNLITAFEPDQERIELYEKLKKKQRKN